MAGASTQRYGWAWCAGAAVLFGAATPAIKLLVDDAGPVTLAGLLYLGAALAVMPLARRDPAPRAGRSQRTRLALAVFLTGLSRPGGSRLGVRTASLIITAAALAAIQAQDLVTLAITWAVLDLAYFISIIFLVSE